MKTGDYVNGRKVYKEDEYLYVGNYWLENVNIKSIVTKEQFEEIKYEVK